MPRKTPGVKKALSAGAWATQRNASRSMVLKRDDVEAAATRALAEPAFAGAPGTGVVAAAWDGAGRLVWVSAGLDASTEAGAPALPPPTMDRIKALASGLAPLQSFRLERLRFDPRGLAPPTTCACRLLPTAMGETVLLTAFFGPAPRLSRPAEEASVLIAEAKPAPVPTPRPAEEAEEVPVRLRDRGTVR